ncbi:MAG: ROK family protein [Polyangiaceae bacterium]
MRIGVDLGGTKIEALALDDDGVERDRRRIATPRHGGADAIVDAIATLVGGLERGLGVTARVGIGTPGALSPTTGALRNSNTTCLNGVLLDRLLSEALEREVRIANDANCFALSEAIDGAGEGAAVVFGVILGTGTGGGVVVNERVIAGANAIAGEWGHNPLPWPDEEDVATPCYCGKRGCLETWLSGPAMARDHALANGEHIDARAIAARAAGGEPNAVATLGRYRRRLAKGLSHVINVLDPDVVVLGGGLSNIDALRDDLPLTDYVFSDTVRTRVVRARHGDSSGVRGAAWLWPVEGDAR